jgi:drug/metabolite transporter (DMT)-like permease
MKFRVILATAAMTFLASFTTIAGKQAALEVDPFAIVYLRYILAFFILSLILRYRHAKLVIDRKDIKPLVFLMLTGIILNQNFFVIGLRYTIPSHISLIYATTSVWVIFLNWINGKKHPVKKQIYASIITVFGVSIVIGSSLFVFNKEIFIGDLIILGATLSWASYTAFGKEMVHKYGPIKTTFIVLCGAVIVYTPVGIPRVFSVEWQQVSTLAVLGIVYMGLFTSGISYVLYYYILKHLEAQHLGLMVSAQPPTTVILSIIAGFEILRVNTILGIIIIGSGILLASRENSESNQLKNDTGKSV